MPRVEAGRAGGTGAPAFRLERAFVLLVAAHSAAVGVALALAPDLAVQLGGFPPVRPPFFARQAGVFHLVLAAGYLLEHFRRRGVLLLVTAKLTAAAFLALAVATGETAWAVPLSGAADGLMGVAAWWLHRRALAATAPRAGEGGRPDQRSPEPPVARADSSS